LVIHIFDSKSTHPSSEPLTTTTATAKKHRQACVRRRAELSLQVNESCRERAKEVIDKVFARCYSDTAPFDKIP
jgi:inner membrane protease ATP23